jgi:hypothetical protein
LFAAGATFEGWLYCGPEEVGTASSLLVIGSLGIGRAIISSGSLLGLYALNTAGFEVRNLAFEGPASLL